MAKAATAATTAIIQTGLDTGRRNHENHSHSHDGYACPGTGHDNGSGSYRCGHSRQVKNSTQCHGEKNDGKGNHSLTNKVVSALGWGDQPLRLVGRTS